MIKKAIVLLTLFLVLFSYGRCIAKEQGNPTALPGAKINLKRANFRLDVRKLYEERVIWTRMYVISLLYGLPDEKAVRERLLRNDADIGKVIKLYYTEDAGSKFRALLDEDISIEGRVLSAARAGDADKVNKEEQTWYMNADDMAAFLNAINSNLFQQYLQDLFHERIDIMKSLLKARLKKDYAADIEVFDLLHGHYLKIADALSSGIIKQFPDKFDK